MLQEAVHAELCCDHARPTAACDMPALPLIPAAALTAAPPAAVLRQLQPHVQTARLLGRCGNGQQPARHHRPHQAPQPTVAVNTAACPTWFWETTLIWSVLHFIYSHSCTPLLFHLSSVVLLLTAASNHATIVPSMAAVATTAACHHSYFLPLLSSQCITCRSPKAASRSCTDASARATRVWNSSICCVSSACWCWSCAASLSTCCCRCRVEALIDSTCQHGMGFGEGFGQSRQSNRHCQMVKGLLHILDGD